MAHVALPMIFLGGVIASPDSVTIQRHLHAALDQDAGYVNNVLLIPHVKVKWALWLSALSLVPARHNFMGNVVPITNVIMEEV